MSSCVQALCRIRFAIPTWTRRREPSRHLRKSAATRRAYNSHWRHSSGWCVGQGASSLSADDQTRYFTHVAQTGLAVTTIIRRAAAISFAHRHADYDSPIGHEVNGVPQIVPAGGISKTNSGLVANVSGNSIQSRRKGDDERLCSVHRHSQV